MRRSRDRCQHRAHLFFEALSAEVLEPRTLAGNDLGAEGLVINERGQQFSRLLEIFGREADAGAAACLKHSARAVREPRHIHRHGLN